MNEETRLRKELERLQRRYDRLERTAQRQADFAERNKALMYRIQQDLRAEIAQHEQTAVELRDATQVAESATRAKSRFLANMSHEIRTPANAVIGLLDLIAAEATENQLLDRIEVARNAARDLVNIVDDLLDLSEIEAEKTRLQTARFCPWDAIDDTVAVLAPAAAAKGLAIAVRIEPIPSSVEGDATRFRQVLRNLLSNAIKFTLAGGVTVSCRFWDGQLVVAVQDTGPGIPNELMPRLFEPFDRLDAPDHGPSGRGLGLSISRHLARLMGGDLTCESTRGQGATFLFRCAVTPVDSAPPAGLPPVQVVVSDPDVRRHLLAILDDLGVEDSPAAMLTLTDRAHVPGVLILAPLADATSGTRPTLRRPLRRRAVEHVLSHLAGLGVQHHAPVLHPFRILLVEDNVTNQLVATSMLRHLGCDVVVACHGQEALDLLDEGPFDLVLMDCQMPVLDGYEATRRIRSGAVQPDVPILALTAHALASDAERCREAGMDGYLAKPIRLTDLQDLLTKYGDREAI